MGWTEDLKTTAGLQAMLLEHGPRLATAVLVALLAVQAGVLVTVQNRGTAPGPAGAGLAGPAAIRTPWPNRDAPALEVGSIVAAHLFGTASSGAADPNAPQTAVQLVLAGVLAVPDPKRGLALIGPNAATARLYTVGSAVPGGVSLHAVYPDRVLLNRSGIIESLLLPKKLLAQAPPPVGAGAGAQSPAQRLAALAQGNGALLGGLVRAQPVFAGGKLSGYRIFPGGRASVGAYTQLGLRPGDLVTAVNGTLLDDPNRGNEILQTLSSASSATLTVQRNGTSQDLNLNLETVVSEAESAAAQAAAAARRGGAFGGPLGGMAHLPGPGGGPGAPAVAEGGDGAAPPPAEPAEPAANAE
jgi:general secretion pathway protein C